MTHQVVDQANQFITWIQTRSAEIALTAIYALALLAIGALVIHFLSKALARTLEKTKLGRESLIAKFIVSVAVKTAWAFLVVIVLGKLGVDVGPIIAGLGVTGFVLGFAFQESLGSFAAGLMIALNKPFKVGDYVAVAGFEGSITALDMMAVTLATADNRKITIPNKQAWGQPIVNYSALAMRRVDLTIGIAYGADIELAQKTAIATLAAMSEVVAEPAPMAEVKSLDDSAVTLTVRAWVKNADYWKVFFNGNRLIKKAFDAAGLAIPFPQIDVHMV